MSEWPRDCRVGTAAAAELGPKSSLFAGAGQLRIPNQVHSDYPAHEHDANDCNGPYVDKETGITSSVSGAVELARCPTCGPLKVSSELYSLGRCRRPGRFVVCAERGHGRIKNSDFVTGAATVDIGCCSGVPLTVTS